MIGCHEISVGYARFLYLKNAQESFSFFPVFINVSVGVWEVFFACLFPGSELCLCASWVSLTVFEDALMLISCALH